MCMDGKSRPESDAPSMRRLIKVYAQMGINSRQTGLLYQ